MVVLHEDAVEEPEAVVGAAAAEDGVFLQEAQPWRGLAGVEDERAEVIDEAGEGARHGGDAAQALHEVEGGALGGEDGARRPLEAEDVLPGGGVCAIGRDGLEGHLARGDGRQDRDGDGDARDAAVLARQDGAGGADARLHEGLGRRVAGAEILVQGELDRRREPRV